MTVFKLLPLTLILVVVFGVVANIVNAKEESPAIQEAGMQNSPPKVQPIIVSIDFPEGSVAEYVAALRKYNVGINVVIESATGEVLLPAISLRNASVANALNIISLTPHARESGLTVQTFSARTGEAGDDVFVISIKQLLALSCGQLPAVPPAPRQGVPTKRQAKVFSLNQLTKAGSEELDAKVMVATLSSVIKVALDIKTPENARKAVLKLDEASGLLMVYGTREQIGLVTQVLAEVSKDTSFRQGEVAWIRRLLRFPSRPLISAKTPEH